MAIVFTDGFDAYGTAAGTNLLTRWATNTGQTFSSTTPYGVGQSISINTSTNSFPVSLNFTAAANVTVGFAFRTNAYTAAAPGTGSTPFLYLNNSSTNMIGLQLNIDGSLQVNRQTSGSGGTSLGFTNPNIIKLNTWYYIELGISVSDTVGTVRLDVDGSTLLNLTGQDTRNGTPTNLNILYIGSHGSTAFTILYDDFYMTDTAVPLGPRRIYTLRPNLDTAQKQWTALSGANNSAMVGETIIDGDTSYVQASNVSDFDLYDIANTGVASATVSCVNHLIWARKTDATARSITLTTKSGSTTTDSTNNVLTTSYVGYNKIYETDPNTTLAWTMANIDALQIGQKIVV